MIRATGIRVPDREIRNHRNFNAIFEISRKTKACLPLRISLRKSSSRREKSVRIRSRSSNSDGGDIPRLSVNTHGRFASSIRFDERARHDYCIVGVSNLSAENACGTTTGNPDRRGATRDRRQTTPGKLGSTIIRSLRSHPVPLLLYPFLRSAFLRYFTLPFDTLPSDTLSSVRFVRRKPLVGKSFVAATGSALSLSGAAGPGGRGGESEGQGETLSGRLLLANRLLSNAVSV